VTTGRVDQERAPIWETLTGYARSGIYGFHTPGHKSGRFTAPEIEALVGKRGLELDLPAMTATDNTFHPTGCLFEAQQLASELFGAGETIFLTAGSTLGVATALLATIPPGHTVALPRNIHRSVVAGLVLSGALPRFIPHDVLPESGALGVTAEQLAATLDRDPKPAAVLLTRPSYYGLARDLKDAEAICHNRQIPLIVDEAHGAHLHFLPKESGPSPALAAGADLVVQSCHKTLGSLLGSAQLHIGRESIVDAAQVHDAINVLQTTSPSFLLLASLDVVRRWLWREGKELFAAAVDEARQLEDAIDEIEGMHVLRPENVPQLAGHRRDPLRLVVNVIGTGWSGYDVEDYLTTEFQIEDEMADWFNVTYVLSPHDDATARERLLAGLRSVSGKGRGSSLTAHRRHEPSILNPQPSASLLQPPIPPLGMPPRKASLARKATVPLADAAGRTSAEMVMFYPPGIPLLMPGEMVTAETIDVCRRLQAAGAVAYASDSTLATIRVVE
jgi:arginine decarboxylase